MNKKDVGFVPQVDFKEQTPDVLLKTEKPDPLYKKANLSIIVAFRLKQTCSLKFRWIS